MHNPMNNIHSDILKADIPTDSAKLESLLSELKERAKGAFQAKDLVNAECLYAKAIQCRNTEHLLYSNRAAVRLLLKKLEGAIEDCDECLKLEPAFIKAHFRKAQALQRLAKFDEAVKCIDKAFGVENGMHKGNQDMVNLKAEVLKEWEEDKKQKADFNKEAQEASKDLLLAPPVPTTRIATRIEMESSKKKKTDALLGLAESR